MHHLMRSKRSENTGPDRRILGDPKGHYQRDYSLIMHLLPEGDTGLKVRIKSEWLHRILPEGNLRRYVEIGRHGGDDHTWMLSTGWRIQETWNQVSPVPPDGTAAESGSGSPEELHCQECARLIHQHSSAFPSSSCPCGLGGQWHGTTHAYPWQDAQNSAPCG